MWVAFIIIIFTHPVPISLKPMMNSYVASGVIGGNWIKVGSQMRYVS